MPRASTWTKRRWLLELAETLASPAGEAIRRDFAESVSPGTVLDVAELYAAAADSRTGRNVTLAHDTIADRLDCHPRTVQRAATLLELLGFAGTVERGRYLHDHERRTGPGRAQRRMASVRDLRVLSTRARALVLAWPLTIAAGDGAPALRGSVVDVAGLAHTTDRVTFSVWVHRRGAAAGRTAAQHRLAGLPGVAGCQVQLGPVVAVDARCGRRALRQRLDVTVDLAPRPPAGFPQPDADQAGCATNGNAGHASGRINVHLPRRGDLSQTTTGLYVVPSPRAARDQQRRSRRTTPNHPDRPGRDSEPGRQRRCEGLQAQPGRNHPREAPKTPQIGAQRLAGKLAARMPWLLRGGLHVWNLARGLDRLGITDADWTVTELLDELAQWRTNLGVYAIPAGWQHSPIGLLLHELQRALAHYLAGSTPTPGARRRRETAHRAAAAANWRAGQAAAETNRATPDQVRAAVAGVRDQLRRAAASRRPSGPDLPVVELRPRAW